MTVMKHQLLLPGSGGYVAGGLVRVGLPVSTFIAGGHQEIQESSTAVTDAQGNYSFDLTPQSQVTAPNGTYYIVTHPNGEQLTFTVPDGPGPFWIYDNLVENPAAPSPVYAGIKTVTSPDGTITSTVTGQALALDVEPGVFPTLAGGGTFATTAPVTHRAPLYIRADEQPSPLTNGVVIKPAGDGTVAAWWLVNDDNVGYTIHMGGTVNWGNGYVPGTGLAFIGMGTMATHQNGSCILLDNRGTGGANGPGTIGLVITNFGTTTSYAAGLNQAGTAGRSNTLLHLDAIARGASPLLGFDNSVAPGTVVGQQYFWVVDGGGLGDAGEIRADTGDLNWQRYIRTRGAPLVAAMEVGSADPVSQVRLAAHVGYYPQFGDGVTTQGSTAFQSATGDAKFTSADVGKLIWGGGIAAGTTIASVTDASNVVLSYPATATATGVQYYLKRSPGNVASPAITWYKWAGGSGATLDQSIIYRMGPVNGLAASTQCAIETYNSIVAPGSEDSATSSNWRRIMTFDKIAGAARIGLYSAAPVPQAADVGLLTDSTGGTVSNTLAAGITDPVAKNAIASLAAQVNAIRNVLHNLGATA